jgi:hypothetical protein
MAIGTLAAIGLAAGGIGAVASSSAQKNAAKNAQQASNYAADQSAAVLRENYDKSAAALAPWQRSGLQANDAINALLGLGGGFSGGPDYAQIAPNPMGQFAPNAMAQFMGGQGAAMDQYGFLGDARMSPLETPMQGGMQFGPAIGQQVTTTVAPQSAQQRYENAFDNYRKSTGYQFRLNQGMGAINSGYAGAGSLKSGAAMKAINDYGQNMASQEFANYLGALGNQQAIGSNAASAQAGVSQNLGNSLAQIAMQRGDNNANAALARGGSGFGNALSMIGGGLFRMGM